MARAYEKFPPRWIGARFSAEDCAVIAERIAAKTELQDGPLTSQCLVWLAAKTDRGYGRLKFRGRLYYPHRLAVMLATGKMPRSLLGCHRCNNPSCCNPEHIELASQSRNMCHWFKTRQGLPLESVAV